MRIIKTILIVIAFLLIGILFAPKDPFNLNHPILVGGFLGALAGIVSGASSVFSAIKGIFGGKKKSSSPPPPPPPPPPKPSGPVTLGKSSGISQYIPLLIVGVLAILLLKGK